MYNNGTITEHQVKGIFGQRKETERILSKGAKGNESGTASQPVQSTNSRKPEDSEVIAKSILGNFKDKSIIRSAISVTFILDPYVSMFADTRFCENGNYQQ